MTLRAAYRRQGWRNTDLDNLSIISPSNFPEQPSATLPFNARVGLWAFGLRRNEKNRSGANPLPTFRLVDVESCVENSIKTQKYAQYQIDMEDTPSANPPDGHDRPSHALPFSKDRKAP